MSRHQAWLGGPGTVLPRPAESFLGWTLALSCLAVSGYHFLLDSFVKPWFTRRLLLRRIMKDDSQLDLPCWLPLMCHSWGELERATPHERYQQLVELLNRLSQEARDYNVDKSRAVPIDCSDPVLQLCEEETLVELIRTNDLLRRLVSLAMRPDPDGNVRSTPLGQTIVRLWPRLLVLPTLNEPSLYLFAISLIVPCYHERAADILQKLHQVMSHCDKPSQVQVFLVLSGANAKETFIKELNASQKTLTQIMKDHQNEWGGSALQIVTFREESGRGPCLNFGALNADGAVYAFCHSDTQLPFHWDSKLLETFYPSTIKEKGELRPNSCAFGFGIDTSAKGLEGQPLPPGIRAVEYTANLRCNWWSLPYGDQCLCLPASTFEYIGGFPHQPLMEDYDLISILRKRAALLPKFLRACKETSSCPGEKLVIVPGAPALCSPRRWQRFGVVYVTFTNSRLVALYAMGRTSPDEIYRMYYGQRLAVTAPKSPWETQLKTLRE